MQKTTISLTQQKILLASGLILLGVIVVWFGLYRPMYNRAFVLKAKLANLERQIHDIEAVTVAFVDKEVGIKELEKRSQALDAQFLSDEEAGYKIISGLAKKQGVEIVSLQPEPKVDYMDAGGQRLAADNKLSSKVPVTVELKGSYKDVVAFVDALEHSSELFVTFDGIKITKSDFKVLAVLNITFYLLS